MHFQSFDSMEEMQRAMAEAEAAANSRVTDQQRNIRLGDHWIRPMGAEYDYIWIVGRIHTADELVASNLILGDDHHPSGLGAARRLIIMADASNYATPFAEAFEQTDVDVFTKATVAVAAQFQLTYPDRDQEVVDEFVGTSALMHDAYHRGYRFGRAYSPIVPDGELGDTHISEMVPISPEEFRSLKERDFDIRPLFAEAGWARDMMIDCVANLDLLHKREV